MISKSTNRDEFYFESVCCVLPTLLPLPLYIYMRGPFLCYVLMLCFDYYLSLDKCVVVISYILFFQLAVCFIFIFFLSLNLIRYSRALMVSFFVVFCGHRLQVCAPCLINLYVKPSIFRRRSNHLHAHRSLFI